jgi:hypothetical protein
MSAPAQPRFYKPVFGNDNFYAPDVIDIATFTNPTMYMADAAATAPAKKLSEK